MSIKSYNRIASIYEHLGQIYSGGKIYAAKASQVRHMRSRNAVLYVGVGPGEDAVLAAEQGADVTCIDVAPGMLRQVESRFQAAGLKVNLICEDVLNHNRIGHYDVVVVNFFLNVFAEPSMKAMLAHLATLVKPGGRLLISDFAAPRGNWFERRIQAWYWGVTNLFYFVLRLCAWHPVYDYPRYFAEAGLKLAEVERFPLGRFGPQGFCAITAVRCAS